MSTDTNVLEQAKFLLEGAQDCLDRIGDLDAGHRAQTAQAAALIAIAEQAKRIADVLEGAYDPNSELIKVEAWSYDARRELG